MKATVARAAATVVALLVVVLAAKDLSGVIIESPQNATIGLLVICLVLFVGLFTLPFLAIRGISKE